MTDQGEDILAWLDAAISKREQSAQASIQQATVNLAGADPSSVSVWRVIERPATGTFVATRDQWDRVAEVVPTYGGAHAEHIALNDPASVLRRCASDRKALTLYTETVDIRDRSAASIQAAQDRGGMPDPCVLDDWSRANREAAFMLPLIEILAEGYGWTGGER